MKKKLSKCRQHPPFPTLHVKKSKKCFFSKKTEMVGNIPKCDERHRWRQKPDKKIFNNVNTPPPSIPYMQKMVKFFRYPRSGVKHSKILLKASQSSIMREKVPVSNSSGHVKSQKRTKTNKDN